MNGQSDPVEKIMLRPRTFVMLLAGLAMVIGLLLGLVPARVSTPDAANPGKVTCGNTLNGVETAWLVEDLGTPDRETLVSYIEICDQAINNRAAPAWTLFFAGMLVVVFLGAVRHKFNRTQRLPDKEDSQPDTP
jgi:disulfide bond formation protein DsbB